MKANKLLILALFLGSSSQYQFEPNQIYDDITLDDYVDIDSPPPVEMTKAATPELEVAEKEFREAKLELNASDANFQRCSAKVNKTIF